jgi:hypothetical protein
MGDCKAIVFMLILGFSGLLYATVARAESAISASPAMDERGYGIDLGMRLQDTGC